MNYILLDLTLFTKDNITFLIAILGFFMSAYLFFIDKSLKKRKSIPVLVIKEEQLIGDYLKYNANNGTELPFCLVLNNSSEASAFNVEIKVRPDFQRLIENKLLIYHQKENIYLDNHTYRINIGHGYNDDAYFLFSETKLPENVYDQFIITRDSITGLDSVQISNKELFPINNLMDSASAIYYSNENNFNGVIPIFVDIYYENFNGKKYFSKYELEIKIAGITQDRIDGNLEITEIRYQVLKNKFNTNTFNTKL